MNPTSQSACCISISKLQVLSFFQGTVTMADPPPSSVLPGLNSSPLDVDGLDWKEKEPMNHN